LQGSLFILGAYLKQEARSYLKAKGLMDMMDEDLKKEEESHYEIKIRDMHQHDIDYFE
jgi:hypothetical protein